MYLKRLDTEYEIFHNDNKEQQLVTSTFNLDKR